VRLLEQQGSPPKLIWLTCGNTSEEALQQILSRHLSTALALLDGGEDLVEIGSP
jgi:predicted nuclease of predicted toxin-antitoxin system